MAELKETKSYFKLIGVVSRIDKDGAFREEMATRGRNQGKIYRALRFGVKTSDTNEIIVEMFDFEPEKVYLWNSNKKEGDSVPLSYWKEQKDELRESGYTCLQTRVGLEYDERGKLVAHGMPSFEASRYIFDNLKNGDSVVVEGEIRYSTYRNREDKEVVKKSYIIKKLFKLKEEVDFDAEDFEETTYFEQEMVYVGADMDNREKKVYVTGRVIDFNKNFYDTQFVVDFSDGDEGMKRLAESFVKRFKFGDVLKVYGDTLNRVILEEVADKEEDDLLASLGGRRKPKKVQGYMIKNYISEMQIYGVDTWERGIYTESDFVNKEDDLFAELGGKAKPVKNNPFDFEDDDPFSDSDLPF